MHILHIVGGLGNSSGTTWIVLDLSRELLRLGHTVDILYVQGRFPDAEIPPDLRHIVVPCRWDWSRSWVYSRQLGHELARRLTPAMRDASTIQHPASRIPDPTSIPDLVHVHSLWYYPLVAAARAARRAGKPLIVSPQGALSQWSLGRGAWKKRLYAALVERRLLNGAACIHCVSEAEESEVRSFGVMAPCRVIPNGVNVEAFRDLPDKTEARRRLGIAPYLTERGPDVSGAGAPSPRVSGTGNANEAQSVGRHAEAGEKRDAGEDVGGQVILFLGRLNPKKGVDILIRAFALYRKQNPSVRLMIAGDDAGSGHAGELRRLADECGLLWTDVSSGAGPRSGLQNTGSPGRGRPGSSSSPSAQVLFLGEVGGERKRLALAAADVFVLPSRSEGQPIAALEAMAMGLPVIVTKACAIHEIAAAGAGVVVEANAEATAAALGRVLSKPGAFQNFARTLAARHAWSQVARDYVRMYAGT